MYRFKTLKFVFAALAVLMCFGISEVSANLKWSYQTDGHAASPVQGADGTVYAGSHDHHLYAIARDGLLKWKYQAGAPIASSPAIGSDGSIYVISWDRHLHAISPSGSVKWKYLVGTYASCSSPVIASDGTIYLGSDDRNLYAIRPDGSLIWKFVTGRYISSSPAVGSDGTVYVGSSDRYLYAVNSDGTLRWRYQMGNEIASSPVIKDDGTICVGSADAHVYALNPDGTLQWKYQTGGKIYSSPAISSEGTIYVGSYDNYLHALNPDGTLQWKYRTGNRIYSSPAIGPDGAIYVGSDDRKLHVINPDGTPRQQYQTGSYVSSSPAVGHDETVYVGSDDNKIYAINPSEDQNGEDGITSAGGVVYSEDGLAWLTVVIGATSQTVHITIEKSEGVPSSEEGFTRTGNAYDFNAVNAESEPVPLFDEAVEIGMSYDPEGLGSADASDLRIAYYDEGAGQWQELASTADTQLHTASAMTTHLGQFAIFAPVFNSAPQITSSPEILAYLNDGEYIYDVEAEDAEGDTLSFSLAQSPADMTIDAESGLITWMPAIGEHIVEVRVSDGKSVSEQTFALSVDPDIISPFKAGEFTVGSGGVVTVDWLYDGGGYMSDLCFFSTKDMETYRSDPLAFAKEAARRCMSGKDCEEDCADECGADGNCKNTCMEACAEGYLVISDVFEGARYNGSLGESHDWNHGPYKGIKSFRMKPGDKFAAMLVPNNGVWYLWHKLENSTSLTDISDLSYDLRPLYSLISFNSDYGMQMGQAVNIGGVENGIVFEDVDINANEEWVDYNDFIIQVKGASIDLPALDSLIGQGHSSKRKARRESWFDWRTSTDLGKLIMTHVNTPSPQSDDHWISVSLDTSDDDLIVHDLENRMCGREGCYIPGATFQMDENGGQRISLPGLTETQEVTYRLVMHGTKAETRGLAVTGYLGDTETFSEEKDVETEPDQIVMADVTAISSGGDLNVSISDIQTYDSLYDFDGDEDVDEDDVMRVFSKWGTCDGEPDYHPFYDLDDDGCIGILDVMLVRNSMFVP